MAIETLSEVKLVGRALANGWLHEFADRRRKAVHDMFDVIENATDEEMRIKAFAAIVRADIADLKREQVALQKQALDDARRLQLLELFKSLPVGEIGRIASEHQSASDAE